VEKKLKNKLKKVFWCIGAVFMTIFAVLVFVLQCPWNFINYENGDIYQYENLLLDTYNQNNNLGSTPINDIALLGSHDAFAYGINYCSTPNSSENNLFKFWLGISCTGFDLPY